MAKRLMSDKDKKYFEQKTFINICSHESSEKPQRVETFQNGKKGYSFSMPYRVSRGRHDRDSKGVYCQTYDVIFHPDVFHMMLMYGTEFQKFICETAVDGIGRVLSEHKESISKDYKIMKNKRCKGGKPASITIKVETDNPIVNSMDVQKFKTKLEREVTD